MPEPGKTRIVHLIGELVRAGAEKQLFSVATGLRNRGWQQAVIAFDAGGVWEPRLVEAGIPVFVVPRDRLKPRRLWRLWRLVRQQRPQVLMSWSAHVAAYARLLPAAGHLRQVFNMRIDVTVDANSGGPRALAMPMRRGLERADFVVSNSRRNLDVAQSIGLRLPPGRVIYNIVAARGRARPGDPVAAPRIVGVGSLIPRKAYDVLLAALGTLAGEGAGFEFLLAGEGPERPRLEAAARRLGIADRVRFLGEVENVPDLLATAHLLAHPATSEGLSNSILEAMAEGLPVVACPVGAAEEIIDPDRTGLLVPPGDAGGLAAALRRLCGSPGLRQELGRAALDRVRRQCEEAVVLDQYEQVLREVLGERPKPCRTS
jgi:glycosyltransferase involved in cell wall biosynthesis